MDNITEIVNQTAMNLSSVSKQMGLVVSQVQALTTHQNEQDIRMDQIEANMQKYEDRIRLTREQSRTIRNAIHKRASEVLGIERDESGRVKDECIVTDVKYFGKFVSRIYRDARCNSKLGTPYTETYQKDYIETLDYIHDWAPVEGVSGLKDYFDKRAAVKRFNRNR
jgi:hypothetical protein